MSKKQKLKAENKRLRDDIFTLVLHPESTEAMTVKLRYIFEHDINGAILFGMPATKQKVSND